MSRLAVLFAAFVTAACSLPEPEPAAVLGRLPGLGSEPPAAVEPLRLGSETRPAVCPAPGVTLRVEAPPGARRALLALGSRGGLAEFHVGQGGRPLRAFTLPRGDPGWVDHVLPVAGGAPLELRAAAADAAEAPPCFGSLAFLGDPVPPDRPNVVLVSLDTLGAAYLPGFSRTPSASPALDALFERSFAFRRAWAQYPSTLPSHSSLLSGEYPIRHGRYEAGGAPLDSLVSVLAAHGYLAVAFTEDAYFGSAFGFAEGFDRFDDGPAGSFEAMTGNAPETFARAGAWLERFGRETRFFLLVHTYEVHSPYVPRAPESHRVADALTPDDGRRFEPREAAALIRRHNAGTARLDPRTIRRLAALYRGEIHDLGAALSGLIGRLESLGLAERTLVVLTSDHGEQFGEAGKLGHGQTLHNRVLHVPLGFLWPGRIAPGASDAPVQLVDVMPTILDLVGIAPARDLDGRSLAAAIRGEPDGPPRPAFAELQRTREDCLHWRGPGPCWLGRYAVQTGRYKYVVSETPAFERLYDLAEDPGERRDVARERPHVTARHRALVSRYRGQAGAPPPPGAPESIAPETRSRLEALGYLE